MSLALEQRRVRWTTDEYTRMAGILAGRRTELLDGEVIEMAAIGTAHYTVTNRLRHMFSHYFAQQRLTYADPLVIPQFDEPEPDLMVLRQPVDLRKVRVADVELLVEVSDSSYDYDHDVKLPRYQAAGVPLIWIVNIADHAQPRLEEFTRGRPEQRYFGGVVEFGDMTVDLGVLFDGLAELPPDEYETRTG